MQDQGCNSLSNQGGEKSVSKQPSPGELTVDKLTTQKTANNQTVQQETVVQQTAQTGEKVADTLKDTNNAQWPSKTVKKQKKYDSIDHILEIVHTATTQVEYSEWHLIISTLVVDLAEWSDNITITINHWWIVLHDAIFNKIRLVEVMKWSLSSKQLFRLKTEEWNELTPGFLKCESIQFFKWNKGKSIEIELKADFILYDNDGDDSLWWGKKFLKWTLQKDSDGSYYIEVILYSKEEMQENWLEKYADKCINFLNDPFQVVWENLETNTNITREYLRKETIKQYNHIKEDLSDLIDFSKYGEPTIENIEAIIVDLKKKITKKNLLEFLSKARCDIDKFEIVYIPGEKITNDDVVEATSVDETKDNLEENNTEQKNIQSPVQFDIGNKENPMQIAPEIIDIFKKYWKGEKTKKGSSWKNKAYNFVGWLWIFVAWYVTNNFLQNTPTDTSLFPSSQDNNPAQITQNLSDKRSTINSSTPIVKAQTNIKISSIGKILKISSKDKDKYLKQFIKTQGINTSILKTDNFDKYTNKLQGDILNLKYWDEIKVIIKDNIIIWMEAINLENGNKIEYGEDSTVTWQNY